MIDEYDYREEWEYKPQYEKKFGVGGEDLSTAALDEYARQLENARLEGFLAGLFFATSFMNDE